MRVVPRRVDPNNFFLHRITLYEGKYHQLRRMLAVVGNRAVEIKRIQVGPLKLGDLPVSL